MRFFVTGISGFAGTWLASLLLERGDEVFGAGRESTPAREALQERFGTRFDRSAAAIFDLREPDRIREAILASRPDGVFHLAGVAFVPQTVADPDLTYEVNFLGTVAVLRAVADVAPRARVVCVT